MVLSWPNGLTEPLKISHDSLQIFLCVQGAGEQISLRMPMPMLNQPQSVLLSGPLFSRLRIASTGARKASMVKREKGAIVRSCQLWSVNVCYILLPLSVCCSCFRASNLVLSWDSARKCGAPMRFDQSNPMAGNDCRRKQNVERKLASTSPV